MWDVATVMWLPPQWNHRVHVSCPRTECFWSFFLIVHLRSYRTVSWCRWIFEDQNTEWTTRFLCYGGLDTGKFKEQSVMRQSSDDECCATTCEISLRLGKPLAACDLVFPLLRWHAISSHRFSPHARSYVVHVASAQERTLCGNSHGVNFCFNTVWHAFDLLQCSERNARSLGVQLSFRGNPCPDLLCPLLIKRNTTRRSLIVPTVTSSFNWEEVGLRSCSVGDRTRVPSGVGSRLCARSEGEPRPRHTVSTQQRCWRCGRRCPRRSFEGNGFWTFS